MTKNYLESIWKFLFRTVIFIKIESNLSFLEPHKIFQLKSLLGVMLFLLFLSCDHQVVEEERSDVFTETLEDSVYQNSSKKRLYHLVNESLEAENYAEAYKGYSYIYPLIADSLPKEKVEPYLDTLYDLAEKSNQKQYLAQANYDIGMHYFGNRYQYKKAYFYYNNAKKLFLELEDSLNISKSSIRMASVQNKLGDFAGSQNAQIEGLSYLDLSKKENERFLISGYNLLALISSNQHEDEAALNWIQKSIDLNSYSQIRPTLQNNKGMFLLKAGKYEESIQLFKELLEDSLVYKSVTRRARGLDNLGYAQLKSGDRSGLALIQQSIQLLAKENYGPRYAAYLHLADYYKDKNAALSVKNAKKALALVPSVEDELEMYQILALHSNNNEENDYLRKYIHLEDSLSNARLNAANQFAKIRFNSELQEQQILKLEKVNAEKELAIEKENFRHFLIISVISILLVLLIVGFIVIRKKNEKNKNIAISRLENKLSKRVHDEVANEVYTLMNKIEHRQIYSNDEMLDYLDHIYVRSRNISREFDSSVLLKNFHGNLKVMLTSFQSKNANVLIQNSSEEFWQPVKSNLKLTIYRILQELMTNMKKHSNANVVVISFKKEENYLQIQYTDNGKGFNLRDLKFSNGIKNIEARVAHLSGNLDFKETEKGMVIILKFRV